MTSLNGMGEIKLDNMVLLNSLKRRLLFYHAETKKSFKKYEIPTMPTIIRKLSASEQNNAIENICFLRIPCLRTKAF